MATTMVRMIRDGKPSGEPTGLDSRLAQEWASAGKCQICPDTDTKKSGTDAKKGTPDK